MGISNSACDPGVGSTRKNILKNYVSILEEKAYDRLRQGFMGWFNGTYKMPCAVDISKERGSKEKSQIKEEVYFTSMTSLHLQSKKCQ